MGKKHVAILVALLLAIAFVPVFDDDPYFLQIFIMIMLFAYWGTAWNIISGFGGQMSLGHSAFAGIGAYTSTVLFINYHLSPWLGMFVGGLVAGGFGLLIGYPCFKLRGTYFTLATIAFLNVIRILVLANQTVLGFDIRGAQGLSVPWRGDSLVNMEFLSKTPYYYLIFGLLLIILLVSYAIKESKMGYYLAAIKTNQEAANSLGVDVTRYKLLAQFISVFFTAIGGTFYAQFILFIDPQRLFGAELSLEMAIIALIGGQGTVLGPLIGAFILVPVAEATRAHISGDLAALPVILYGMSLMVIIYYLPEGIHKYLGRWIRPTAR
ncbi:MAG: branched-chain amino acid ABC transporter permease [Negativicutes bacterium]